MSIKQEINRTFRRIRHFVLKKSYVNFKIKDFQNNYSDTKRLILFFTPSKTHKISGGILSICTIYSVVKKLKKIHQCHVISSFLPNEKDIDYKYRTFQNDMIIYRFDEIYTKFNNLEYLEVHIPDVLIMQFQKDSIKMKPFYNWANKMKNIHINILNQNDLLMPSLEYILELKSLFPNITMTMAHQQYATIEKRNYYDMPIHLLSPWLNPIPYVKRSYSEKENLILYSPDEIQRTPNGSLVTKKEIINYLKKNLKQFKFIEIKDMKYDNYKDYASKCKYALTFGEGLDGYFTETIFSGGVSFAVYNDVFFTDDFKNLTTLYSSFDDLKEKIVNDIKLLNNKENYETYHSIQSEILAKKYSFEKLKKDATEFYLKEYDFK